MKPVHTYPSFFFKIYFNFILPSMHTCSKWSIQVYPPKLPHTALVSCGATYCAHFIPFAVYVLNCTYHVTPYYAVLSSLLSGLRPSFQIFSQHPLLKHRLSMLPPPQIDRSSFTHTQNKRQNLVLHILIHMILDGRWESKRYGI